MDELSFGVHGQKDCTLPLYCAQFTFLACTQHVMVPLSHIVSCLYSQGAESRRWRVGVDDS